MMVTLRQEMVSYGKPRIIDNKGIRLKGVYDHMPEISLTEQLIREHEQILGLLAKVDKISSLSKDGRKILLELKNCLLAHLEKEDDIFYPGLRKASRANVNLYETMVKFETEMQKISINAIGFFKKYLDEGETTGFSADFDQVSEILRDRIKREEGILYAAYAKLNIGSKTKNIAQ